MDSSDEMEVGDDTHLTVNDGMEVIPGMQPTNRRPHLQYSPPALKAKGNNASGCDVASPQMTSKGAPPEVNTTAENSTVISASPVTWSFNFSQNFVSFNKSSFSINKKHSNNSLAKTQTDDSSDFMNVKSKQCEAVKPICNSTKEVEPMAKNASKLSRMKQITHIASKDASTSSKHHIDKPILPAGACHMLYYQGACKSTSCVNYHQLPTTRVEQFLGKFILYSLLHTDQNQCVWSLLTAHSSSHSRTEPLFVLHVLRHVAQYLNSVPTASTGTNFQVPSQFAFILDCARVCDWGSDQTTRDDVCARGLAVARQVYEVLRRSFVHLPDHLKLEAIRAFVSLSECSKVSGPSGPWSPSEKVLNAGLETAPTKQDDLFSQLDLFWFRSFLAFPDSITVRMIYKHLTKSITSESEFCSIITKEFIEYHNKMGMYNEAYHALPVLQRLGITRPELYQQLLSPAPKSRASYAVTDFAASLPKVLELCGVICHLKVRLSEKYFVHLLGFLLATSRNHTHYVLALQQAADTIVYATQEAGFIPETSLLEQLFSKLSSDFLQLATLQQVFLRLSPELLLANAALMPAILARVKNLPPPAYLVFSALKERLRQIGVVIHLEEDDIYRTEDSSRSGSSGSSKNTTIVENNCSTSLRSKIDSKSDICSQVHSGFIQDKKVKYGNDCLEDIRSELACEYDDQYNAADHSQRQKFCEKREQLKTDNPRYSSLSNASTVNPRVSNVVVASLQRVEPTDNVTQQRVDLISVENNPSLMEGFKITDSLPAWRPQKRPLSSPSIHSKKAYTIQSYFQHQASKRIQSKCIGLDNSQEEKEGASENLDSSVSPESFVLKIDSPEYCHHPEAKEQTPNRDNEKRASDVNKCIFACSSPATSCNSTAISKLNTSLFGCVSPVAPSTSFARNAEKSDSGKDHFNADVSGTNFTKTVTNNTVTRSALNPMTK
ncbi:uncharacterized protein LOC108668624 [Hyalella azteca]|uniref:Uncharacterized protein LOC108668624 n=1 Tax=Hyalella azteca TaxID=294128 RepID=A0A979FSH3_HYAAZ|nr:uncharacterized protein LOC108668624 [Hyalella azteca]